MTGIVRDLERRRREKRIGVALGGGGIGAVCSAAAGAEIAPGARLHGKVERHEKFGVFVFLAPGRTGLIPTKETGVLREADIGRTFPGRRSLRSRRSIVEDATRRGDASALEPQGGLGRTRSKDEVQRHAER